jgi:hypothetical protein
MIPKPETTETRSQNSEYEGVKIARSEMVKSKRQIRKGVWIKEARQFGQKTG